MQPLLEKLFLQETLNNPEKKPFEAPKFGVEEVRELFYLLDPDEKEEEIDIEIYRPTIFIPEKH